MVDGPAGPSFMDETMFDLKGYEASLLEGAWAQVLSQPALRSDQVHANAAGYAQFTEQLLDFVRQHGWWT